MLPEQCLETTVKNKNLTSKLKFNYLLKTDDCNRCTSYHETNTDDEK